MYIPINKVQEDDFFVEYIFSQEITVSDELRAGHYRPERTDFGRLRLDKLTGEVELIHSIGKKGNTIGPLDARAIRKIWLHWSNKEYPDRTQWAT